MPANRFIFRDSATLMLAIRIKRQTEETRRIAKPVRKAVAGAA